MSDFLASLAQRRKRPAAELLWEVNKAFEDAGRKGLSRLSPKARDLHDLVRFCCDIDSIAPWLRGERHVVEKVLAFAHRNGEEEVADILASALEGKAQPAPRFSITLPGQIHRELEVDAGELTQFDGQDWGGTDIALSLAMEGLEEALVDELIGAAGEIELSAPNVARVRKTKSKLPKSAEQEISRVASAAVSALQLVAADGRRTFSKLGGNPNLPGALAWPSWQGKPLAFIAQIDLAEIPRDEGFKSPLKTGRIYFFYDQEQSTWGFDPNDRGSWRVIYSHDPAPENESDAPEDLEVRFNPKPISFRVISVLPSHERLGITNAALSESVCDHLTSLREKAYGQSPKHQAGGYPFAIQNDAMELEAQLASNGFNVGSASGFENPRARQLASGASEWTLLLQIDSDDETRMMWGDCGLIYFWIKQDDLRRAHFDDVWMILQCS